MDLFIENETNCVEPKQYGDELIVPTTPLETIDHDDTVLLDEERLPQLTR